MSPKSCAGPPCGSSWLALAGAATQSARAVTLAAVMTRVRMGRLSSSSARTETGPCPPPRVHRPAHPTPERVFFSCLSGHRGPPPRAPLAGDAVVLDIRTPKGSPEVRIDGAIKIHFLAPDFANRLADFDPDG